MGWVVVVWYWPWGDVGRGNIVLVSQSRLKTTGWGKGLGDGWFLHERCVCRLAVDCP